MTGNIDTAPDGLALRTDGATDFVRQFEHRKALVCQGFAFFDEANFRAKDKYETAADAVKRLERDAWETITARFELQRVMSVKAHQDFWKQVQSDEMPPITVESVLAFVSGVRAQLPDFHRAAVLEVYDWLRPRENDRVHGLKTNTELEVGRRVVLSGMIQSGWKGLEVRYDSGYSGDPRLRLLALERVLRALDGRGMVAAGDWSEVQQAIDGRTEDPDGRPCERVPGKPVGETEFFKYRACKNQNLHLEFKRLDLLAKLNAVAGGKVIKPAHGVTKSPRKRAAHPGPDGRSGAERSERELAFFGTPEALANRVIALADIQAGDIVLEPSAGEGALVQAVRRLGLGNAIFCVEIDDARRARIRDGADLVEMHGDFLAMEPHPVDVVVANPPWHSGSDTHHIAAMLRWLKPGGSLVALASAGLMFRRDAATVELRADIEGLGGRIEEVAGTPFAPATNARCCIVIIPRSA